jgi:integrase
MPYKEKTGTWRGKIYLDGKAYAKRVKTKREALSWENQKRKELKEAKKKIPTNSLLEVGTEYLDYCKKHYNRTTFTDKRLAVKELIEAAGDIDISCVDSNLIMRKILMPQKTPYLHNKRRKDLHAFFEHCKVFYALAINPVSPIKKLPVERKKQPVPTEEEFLKLLMAADRHDRNLLIACATTGGRRSEIFRLTWTDDINFRERKIRLGNRKNRARELRYRWLDMNEELYDALIDQYKTRLPHSDYVFQNRDARSRYYGQGYTYRRQFMEKLCRKAGIEKRVGFHALRRFFASLLADHRESLPTIQKLLGHANVSTTDRYVLRLKDDTKAALDKINFGKKAHEGSTQSEGASGEDR